MYPIERVCGYLELPSIAKPPHVYFIDCVDLGLSTRWKVCGLQHQHTQKRNRKDTGKVWQCQIESILYVAKIPSYHNLLSCMMLNLMEFLIFRNILQGS